MAQGDYQQLADAAAAQWSIPTPIFNALINQESGWNNYATGTQSEIGLTQLTPSVYASAGINPYDPTENLNTGAQYLSQQYAKYGNWPDALSAYNSGYPANQSTQGRAYANSVLTAASANMPATSSDPWYVSILKWINPSGVTGEAQGATDLTNTAANAASSWFDTFIAYVKKFGIYIAVILGVLILLAVSFSGAFKEESAK